MRYGISESTELVCTRYCVLRATMAVITSAAADGTRVRSRRRNATTHTHRKNTSASRRLSNAVWPNRRTNGTIRIEVTQGYTVGVKSGVSAPLALTRKALSPTTRGTSPSSSERAWRRYSA